MSNFKKYTISDLVNEGIIEKPLDGNHGSIHPTSADYISEGIPFIMATDIINGQIDLTHCKFISEETAKKLRKGFAKVEDVLLTHKASIGRTAIVPSSKNEYLVLTPQVTYYRIKDKKRLYNKYLKYYFDSKEFQDHLNNFAGAGSTRAYIGITEQQKLSVRIPESIETQTRIASILSALDDKIELNRRTNHTLEQMAQTLFKKYFVTDIDPDNLPEGWRFERLKSHIKIKNGFAFKGNDFIEGGVPVLKIKNVKAGKILLDNLSYVSKSVADKCKQFEIKKNDLLITMTGNRMDGGPDSWVGKVALFFKDGHYLLNQRISKIETIENDVLSKYYLSLLFTTEDYQYYFVSHATSSGGQANISPDLINNIKVLLPPTEIMQSFNTIVKSLYDKMFLNEIENEKLTAIRETLLPKLMSGELTVN